jgi:hypothetical protein
LKRALFIEIETELCRWNDAFEWTYGRVLIPVVWGLAKYQSIQEDPLFKELVACVSPTVHFDLADVAD